MSTPSQQALNDLKRDMEKDAQTLRMKKEELERAKAEEKKIEGREATLQTEIDRIEAHQQHIKTELDTMQRELEEAIKNQKKAA